MSMERIAEIEAEVGSRGFVWLLQKCNDMHEPKVGAYMANIFDHRRYGIPGWARYVAYADTPMDALEAAFAQWREGVPSRPGGWTPSFEGR